MGNDVVITVPVCWSLKMHSTGRSRLAGNIMLGDGSSQQGTSQILYLNWLKPEPQNIQAQGAPANAAGIRLIFP